jgi:hypothetical protein
MTESEPEYVLVTATCHTEGCGNAEWALEIYVPPEPVPPNVVCGVCNQPITDIVTPPSVQPTAS